MPSKKISVVVRNNVSGEVMVPKLRLKLTSNVKELKQRIMRDAPGNMPNFFQSYRLFVDKDCEKIELTNPRQVIHDTLLCDKSVIFVDVDADKECYLQKKMSNTLRHSVLTRVKNGCGLERHEKIKFQDDKEIALAMATRGHSIAYISEWLRNDKEIALAMAPRGYSMAYISERLRDDKDIVLVWLSHSSDRVLYMSHRLRDDKDVALAVVRRRAMDIQYLSSRMNTDFDVAKAAVSRDIRALTVCSVLRDNAEFMMDIVKHNGFTLQFASDRLKCDKNIVTAAVKQNGFALQFASDRLKCDKDIVMVAVMQHGASIRYTPNKSDDTGMSLRLDKNVVMAAVTNDFTALKYMPRLMYADKDVASCIAGMRTRIKQSI
jgi:hypothetical protein